MKVLWKIGRPYSPGEYHVLLHLKKTHYATSYHHYTPSALVVNVPVKHIYPADDYCGSFTPCSVVDAVPGNRIPAESWYQFQEYEGKKVAMVYHGAAEAIAWTDEIQEIVLKEVSTDDQI